MTLFLQALVSCGRPSVYSVRVLTYWNSKFGSSVFNVFVLQVQQALEQQFQVLLRLYCTYLGTKFINFMSLLLKIRLGSGWSGGPSPIFLIYGAESADLNEGSLRARHAKARLRARGHLKSFDTPGFRGGVSNFFMTLNG